MRGEDTELITVVLVLAGFLLPLSALDFTVHFVEGILSLNGCHVVLRNEEDYPLMTISVLGVTYTTITRG